MCNIAGYVGTKQSAPILVEMLRRQQGMNGGYYTGIATLHGGRIHYAKVRGDLDELLRRYDVCSMPGSVGIIHSRTPDMGDDLWSHPFLYGEDDDLKAACVLNGSIGAFGERKPDYCRMAEKIASEGHAFRTRAMPDSEKIGISFSDGSHIHVSDLFTTITGRYLDGGEEPSLAIEKTLSDMPLEVVCLMLTKGDDFISFGKVNMPMNLGFTSHGVYLASSATAFFDDVTQRMQLPENTRGRVTAKGVEIYPQSAPKAKVVPITGGDYKAAYDLITEKMANGYVTFDELFGAIRIPHKEGESVQTATLIYEIFASLKSRGLLEITERRVPGMAEGLSAPVSMFRLKSQPVTE